MKNSNALVAMAQVSQNSNDPYAVFCEYIKYCIFTHSSDVMMLKDIGKEIRNQFGIKIPYNIMLKCISQIEKAGLVQEEKHQIKRCGIYNTEEFEKNRIEFMQMEDSLIESLISYALQYGRKWTKEYAREQLIRTLDRDGLAYEIFINQNSENDNSEELLPLEDYETDEESEQPLYKDSFFVGRFIQQILSSDNLQKIYLQKVCEGLMICIGVYQLPSDENATIMPNIKNAPFYLDTRLLLRYIGCAGEAAVEATRELVGMIQNAGGKAYYYPHTFEEMNNAFEDAIKQLSKGGVPRDEEMRLYCLSIDNSVTVLASKKAGLVAELEKSNIFKRFLTEHENKERIKYAFDKEDLYQYMQAKLKWDTKTIENDVDSIWETHMLRGGEYSDYFGTGKRIPVFVTTNPILVNIVQKYRDERQGVKGIKGWNQNRLPIISDIRLTCRLWTPAVQGERLSLLYLSANAVAAQKPTQSYINKMRQLVCNLKEQVPEYSQISLPDFFDDYITSEILNSTKGEDKNFNIGTFASTITELVEWKAKEQEEKTAEVAEKLAIQSNKYEEQSRVIVEGAVAQNVNKIGIETVVIKFIFGWPVIVSIFFVVYLHLSRN